MKNGTDYANSLISKALTASCGGVDIFKAESAVGEALDVLLLSIQAVKDKIVLPDGTPNKTELDRMRADVTARMMKDTVKVIDDMARLVQFARGGAEATDDRGESIFAALSGKQLDQVERWVKENKNQEELAEGGSVD